MKKLNILSVLYDCDLGSIIRFEKNGVEQNEMIVQLSGGEYLSQMGCQISFGDDGDFCPEDPEKDSWFGDLIISAEKAYEEWVEELKNEESNEGEIWEFDDYFNQSICSATSSSDMTVEVSNQGRYRVFIGTTGFTQPGDYSSLPDFEAPKYFENESEYDDYRAEIAKDE